MKFLVAIILAVILAEAELDIVVPSLPALQDFLGVSVFQTEWLLTANLLAHGLSALFMGHLGDRYGKRRM
ncbi:MAG: MFS transporter, partial [Burkholderiales bacterium]